MAAPLLLPPVVKKWSFSLNNRIVFVSLNDTMSKLLFGLKNFLVATMGYTVKYTCDGTTGPTSSSDHTDRWASAANCTTRGASAAAAQSFAVLTDGNGVDLLLTYQGASDDVARISFSPSALFLPAGTANQQPTATDEQVMVSANSLINSTTSSDRVWHLMATSDKKLFRIWVFRLGSMIYSWGLEAANTTGVLAPNISFPGGAVGWATNNSTITSVGNGHVVGAAIASSGGVCLLNSTNALIGGCGEGYQGGFANPFSSLELQAGGASLVPVGFATATTGVSGKLGNRYDCWYGYWAVTPAQADTLGDLTHIFLGTGIHPWDGATYPQTT